LEILQKLKTGISNLNETSLKLMKHGAQFAVGVCLTGLAAYIINSRMYIFNYSGEQFAIHIMLAGVSLFMQFIIGGLVLDIFQKRRQN